MKNRHAATAQLYERNNMFVEQWLEKNATK